MNNLTPFRKEVYEVLLSIPFGNVLTYGDIAKTIANRLGGYGGGVNNKAALLRLEGIGSFFP